MWIMWCRRERGKRGKSRTDTKCHWFQRELESLCKIICVKCHVLESSTDDIKLLWPDLFSPLRYRLPPAGCGDSRPAPGPDGGQTQPLHVRLRGLPVRCGPPPLPDGRRPPRHGHLARLQLWPEDPPHPDGGQHRGGCWGPSEERLRRAAGDGARLLRGEHRGPPSCSAGMRPLQSLSGLKSSDVTRSCCEPEESGPPASLVF